MYIYVYIHTTSTKESSTANFLPVKSAAAAAEAAAAAATAATEGVRPETANQGRTKKNSPLHEILSIWTRNQSCLGGSPAEPEM